MRDICIHSVLQDSGIVVIFIQSTLTFCFFSCPFSHSTFFPEFFKMG